MHAFVPHQHLEENYDHEHLEKHNSQIDILDCLRLAFHVDMGEGHLEFFNSGSRPDFVLDTGNKIVPPSKTFSIAFYFPPTIKNIQASTFHGPTVFHYTNENQKHFRLRGPPAIV